MQDGITNVAKSLWCLLINLLQLLVSLWCTASTDEKPFAISNDQLEQLNIV